MDILQKPKKALKKFVSKVSIQTVIKNSDAEDTEPLSNPRTRGQWPLTTTVDLRDPKSWPAWKKDLAFVSLLVSTAVVGILKTLFVTTNSVIMAQYNVSYTAAAALTGVPFILAALSGLGSAVLSQVIGKRTIHIAATLVMLAGAVWNMRTMGSYPQFMFARIFQGAGWGAFEGIVMLSVRDIFSPHELPLCFNVLSITSLFFTWGSPILGGYLSQSTFTFRAELLVVNLIQACSVLFALLFFPETSYKPSIPNPGSNTSFSIHSYVSSLRPLPYTASFTRTALQPIRALATPSAFFAVLVVGPITASTFGLSNSLSLLFTSNPVFLFPTHVGFLFILPAGLSLVCAVIITVLMSVSRPPMASYKLLVPGIIVGLAGLLSFGLYTSMHLETQEQNQAHVASGLFARDEVASGLSLPVVSVLFGFLTAASAILGIGLHLHSDSKSWRQAEMKSAIEEAADIAIEGAGRTWIDVLSGIFIIAIPAFASDGQNAGTATWLKDVVIAIMVFQMLACGLVGVVGWRIGEKVKVLDGNIVGINTVKDDARKEGIFSA